MYTVHKCINNTYTQCHDYQDKYGGKNYYKY